MTDEERYHAAAHAMQTGVEFFPDKKDQTPKHLRVGINAAMSDQSGLVMLLIEKGIITKEEYLKSIADAMEREVDAYRKKIAGEYGVDACKVNLA